MREVSDGREVYRGATRATQPGERAGPWNWINVDRSRGRESDRGGVSLRRQRVP